MLFWGAQNIEGACSLKIPNSTIAVKRSTERDRGPLLKGAAMTAVRDPFKTLNRAVSSVISAPFVVRIIGFFIAADDAK